MMFFDIVQNIIFWWEYCLLISVSTNVQIRRLPHADNFVVISLMQLSTTTAATAAATVKV